MSAPAAPSPPPWISDKRYRVEAYAFVQECLSARLDRLERRRHISGQELLEEIRVQALERFGLLAPMVFQHWGVKTTRDFGLIVFNMVDANLLARQEGDSLQDFEGVFDFSDAFRETFKILSGAGPEPGTAGA